MVRPALNHGYWRTLTVRPTLAEVFLFFVVLGELMREVVDPATAGRRQIEAGDVVDFADL